MTEDNGLHEDFNSHDDAPVPSERNFGFTVGVVLVAIAAIRWFVFNLQASGTRIFAGIGLILLVLAATSPSLLKWPNLLWQRLSLLLAHIVNPIVMMVMFLVIFTPVALWMRFRGRDELHLRFDPQRVSNWADRIPPGPTPRSAVNRF